jgi:hypothetical protein
LTHQQFNKEVCYISHFICCYCMWFWIEVSCYERIEDCYSVFHEGMENVISL